MTTRMRHRGCTSVAMVYHGEVPLSQNPAMRSRDWAYPDGARVAPGSIRVARCPDCDLPIQVSPKHLEPINTPAPASEAA